MAIRLIGMAIIGVFLLIFLAAWLNPRDKESSIITEKDQNCWVWLKKEQPLQIKLNVEDGCQWVVESIPDSDQFHVTKMERVLVVNDGFKKYDICYVTGFRVGNKTTISLVLLDSNGTVVHQHDVVVQIK